MRVDVDLSYEDLVLIAAALESVFECREYDEAIDVASTMTARAKCEAAIHHGTTIFDAAEGKMVLRSLKTVVDNDMVAHVLRLAYVGLLARMTEVRHAPVRHDS